MVSTPTLKPDRPIVLLGFGNMGRALLGGWMRSGIDPACIVVVDPYELARIPLHIRRMANLVPEGVDPPTAVVLAVKPQTLAEVADTCRRSFGPDVLYISVAAGKRLDYYERVFGAKRIVRAMPNTPAAVGRGVTVLCASGAVTRFQRELCTTLLRPAGAIEWIQNEDLMDAITAVSGGGPAYVFHLVEALTEAGCATGLPRKLASRLARHTVSGAGELLFHSPKSPQALRQNVTSPAGTTQAALKVLMARDGLVKLMTSAVLAATQRARELSR